MFAIVTTLLGLIPGVATAVQFCVGKFYDSKVAMYQARWGVTRDVAVAAISAEAQSNATKVGWITALASNPVMMAIVVGFALPWIILEWKVIVFDNVWAHWGQYMTDPVRGDIGTWGGIILGGIFVTSGGMGIAHAVLNKRD